MVKSQRCSNVIFTRSFLQRCYNVISQCCVHVVAQRCGLRCSKVAGMLFSQRCKITTLSNVVLMLCVCWAGTNVCSMWYNVCVRHFPFIHAFSISILVMLPLGNYIATWKIAHFPYGGIDPELGRKDIYTTLVRIIASGDKMAAAFAEVFREYGWRRVAMITRTSGGCQLNSVPIYNTLKVIYTNLTFLFYFHYIFTIM